MASTWNTNPLKEVTDIESTISPSLQVPLKPETALACSKIPPFGFNPRDIRSKHNALSIQVSLLRSVFVTNGVAEGQVELVVPKDYACKIGTISVHLVGYEGTKTD